MKATIKQLRAKRAATSKQIALAERLLTLLERQLEQIEKEIRGSNG